MLAIADAVGVLGYNFLTGAFSAVVCQCAELTAKQVHPKDAVMKPHPFSASHYKQKPRSQNKKIKKFSHPIKS